MLGKLRLTSFGKHEAPFTFEREMASFSGQILLKMGLILAPQVATNDGSHIQNCGVALDQAEPYRRRSLIDQVVCKEGERSLFLNMITVDYFYPFYI